MRWDQMEEEKYMIQEIKKTPEIRKEDQSEESRKATMRRKTMKKVKHETKWEKIIKYEKKRQDSRWGKNFKIQKNKERLKGK